MQQLRICFTTDTHGYIFPTNFYSKTHANMPMGLLKLAEAFKKDEHTLIIDGGDTLQGSPLTYYLSKHSPKPLAETFNRMGYDFITLGNHDFNYGLPYLETYINTLNAKCVCANIQSQSKDFHVEPYHLHVMPSGLRVGIFGACTHHITKWEKEETLQKLSIQNPLTSLIEAFNAHKDEFDVSVCIYHGGFECDVTTGKQLTQSDENQAYAIATALPFDILLTGHQHSEIINTTIAGTHVVQNGANAHRFSEVVLTLNHGIKHIQSRHIAPCQTYKPCLAEPLLSTYAQVETWLDKPLGTLSTALVATTPFQSACQGSLIANFINQVQLQVGQCMLSACSLANEIKGFPQSVSVRDVLSTYVYSNTLYVLEISGQTLKDYMEKTASYFSLNQGELGISDDFLLPKVAHYNYDYFYPITYAFDVSKPKGERVVKMCYQGKPILPSDKVRIIVNSYRASGTGGYDMLVGAKVVKDIQQEVSTLIIEALEKTPNFKVDEQIPFTLLGINNGLK